MSEESFMICYHGMIGNLFQPPEQAARQLEAILKQLKSDEGPPGCAEQLRSAIHVKESEGVR